MIKTEKKRFLIIIIVLLLIILPSVVKANLHYGNDRVAYASISSDYTMSEGDFYLKDSEKVYFSASEGATYVFTIREDFYFPIEEIRYSAYQVSDYEDIYTDSQDNIENPFALDSEGEEIDNVIVEFVDDEVSFNQQGKRFLTFEITMYEWAAFQIDVHWDSGEEILVEQSEFIYCTSIDSSPPFISLYANPVFVGDGYRFEFRVTSNSQKDHRSADSGLEKVRIYRYVDDSPEDQTVEEYTSFTTSRMLDTYLIAIKGEYFIEAYDKVGNHSFGRVIKIDYDIDTITRISAIDNVLKNADEYRADLIENLRQKYLEWQFRSLDSDYSEGEVEEALSDVADAQSLCSEAERLFEASLINSELIGGNIEVENFNEENFPYTVKGEKATLQIAFAEFDTKKYNMNVVLQSAQLPNADKVLVLDIRVISDIKEVQKTEFEDYIAIILPMNDYKKVVALSEKTTDSGRVFSNLTVDEGINWVKIYVPSSHEKINLVILSEEAANNNLYWLFLLLILPAVIAIVILRKKLFKKSQNKCDDKVNSTFGQPEKDLEQEKEQKTEEPKQKTPPKNKSKKKIKKK